MAEVIFTKHPDMSSAETEPKYYYISRPDGKFIRKDGVGIVFRNHICEARTEGDIEYLDEQIKHKSLELRVATEEEIKNHKFFVDPRGAMEEEVRNDPKIMEQIRNRIRQEFIDSGEIPGKKSSEMTPEELEALGLDASASKIAGVDPKAVEKPEDKKVDDGGKVTSVTTPPQQLNPTSTKALSEGLAAGSASSGGAPAAAAVTK